MSADTWQRFLDAQRILAPLLQDLIMSLVREGRDPEELAEVIREMREKVGVNRAEIDAALERKHGR